jgi:hypothetical protein
MRRIAPNPTLPCCAGEGVRNVEHRPLCRAAGEGWGGAPFR